MFKMYASNSHSYNHLILAVGIVREPAAWFITSQYHGKHDIGRATMIPVESRVEIFYGDAYIPVKHGYSIDSAPKETLPFWLHIRLGELINIRFFGP